MKIEEQVCSLELAKRLKELKVNQDSLFSWFESEGYGIGIEFSNKEFDLDHYLSVRRLASAFTVAELGEMIPFNKPIKKSSAENDLHDLLMLKHMNGNFIVGYRSQRYGNFVIEYECEKEADARAKMLIHLIENDLLKSPHFNGEPS